jgi:hypothetical protein
MAEFVSMNHYGMQKPKSVYTILKNSVRTSKKTPHFTITKIKWLMLFKEIIAVYIEKLSSPTSTIFSVTD